VMGFKPIESSRSRSRSFSAKNPKSNSAFWTNIFKANRRLVRSKHSQVQYQFLGSLQLCVLN
jgi:hypothetical protein